MNGNPHDQHEKQHETPDRRHEQSEPVEKTGTPDAVEAALVRRDDREHAPAGRRARGVEWVRPTDLIARHGATLSGRGIDFEAEIAVITGDVKMGTNADQALELAFLVAERLKAVRTDQARAA